MEKMVDGIRSRRKKDGTWSHQAYARVIGHKTLTKTFPNKTAAKRWREETEVAMRQGKSFMSQKEQKRTVADVIDRYLERVLKPNNSQYKTKAGHLRWWKEQIGHIPLLQLTRSLLIECREKLLLEKSYNKPKTPATVNRYVSTLTTMLGVAAREWEWIEESKLPKIRKLKESSGRVRYLDEDELERVLAACKKSPNPHLYTVVILALSTGMRQNEIMQLKWVDVDFERKQGVLHKTKNGERRSFPLVSCMIIIG